MQGVGTLVNTWRSHISFYLGASLVVIADQVTKFLVRSNMVLGQSIPTDGPIRITYITNTGGAFGILADQGFLIAIIAIIGVSAILLFYRYPMLKSNLVKVGFGLVLGGAVGNLIDRIYLKHVIDFIDLGAWPIFNIADSAIVIGVILLLYFSIFRMRSQKS